MTSLDLIRNHVKTVDISFDACLHKYYKNILLQRSWAQIIKMSDSPWSDYSVCLDVPYVPIISCEWCLRLKYICSEIGKYISWSQFIKTFYTFYQSILKCEIYLITFQNTNYNFLVKEAIKSKHTRYHKTTVYDTIIYLTTNMIPSIRTNILAWD